MQTRTLSTEIHILTPAEFSPVESLVARHACEAYERSYSPYSHFRVGAAVLLSDGSVVTGCNQENVAYPSGLCAERVAVFAAQAAHPDLPIRMVACAASPADAATLTAEPIVPCGACLQVLLEAEMRQPTPITLLLLGAQTAYRLASIRSVLPLQFSSF